jgi:S-formylglutathione hydrolase FrmB
MLNGVVFLSLVTSLAAGSGPTFHVTTPTGSLPSTFTGRVVVYLSSRGGEPRFGPDWFNPQPCYSIRVKDGKADDGFVIDDARAAGFPGKLSALAPGEYTVQAVIDRNLGGRSIGETPGNYYSKPQKITVTANPVTVPILCDQVIEEPPFVDTDVVKGVRLRSALLSKFYGHEMNLKAAVILPETSDPTERFPVVYEIPGFGGSAQRFSGSSNRNGTDRNGQKVIHVILDPNCPTGHSVFADSANNGSWGKALITELIPYIESHFPAVGQPWARFTRGHSSGGWSSLWLQVAYPDFFGGCWSTSPDPVDFRKFQEVDIYADPSTYRRPTGEPYGVARQNGKMVVTVEQFAKMEVPIRGEQLGSFDAVFGPRGDDGDPIRLYDPQTGAIDAKVAKYWQRYDIWLKLKREWPTIGPKLKGKIHIFMGTEDTFYLDGAVRLLKGNLKTLGSDAEVLLVPGDHGSMMTPDLRRRIDGEIASTILSHKKG